MNKSVAAGIAFLFLLIITPLVFAQDSTAPQIAIYAGDDATGTHTHETTSLTVYANLWNNDFESDVIICQIDWNEGSGWESASTGAENQTYNVSHTYASYGNKSVNYRCVSGGGTTSGHVQHTDYDNITLIDPSADPSPPQVNIFLGEWPTGVHHETITSYTVYANLWNFDAESTVTGCWVDWNDGAGRESVTTGTEATTYIVNHTYSTLGNKTVNYACSNGVGNSSGNLQHTDFDWAVVGNLADASPPSTKIFLGNSSGGNETQSASLTVWANLKNVDSLSIITACSVDWNEGSGWEAVSTGFELVNYSINHTFATSGNKTVNYSCTSSGGTSSGSNQYTNFDVIEILPVAADFSPPEFFNLTTTPASPQSYTPGQTYQVNATITDETGVTSVSFEFNGVNYTTFNQTGNEYSIVFTDLAAGNYNYRWYASDVKGQSNNTGNLVYAVNKLPTEINVTIDGAINQNITINYTQLVSISASGTFGVEGLFLNDTALENPFSNLLLNGGFYNVTGINFESQNHSESRVTIFITVLPLSSNISLFLNSAQANLTVEENTPINFTAILAGPITGFIEILVDGITSIVTGFGSITTSYAINTTGIHIATSVFTGSQNATASNETFNITVVDTVPPLAVSNLVTESVNPSNIVWNWTNPSTYDFTNAILYFNGTNVVNTTMDKYGASGLLPSSVYTLTINTIDDDNNINLTNVTSVVMTLADVLAPLIENVLEPADPSVYTVSGIFFFNATVTDDVKVGTVIFQFNNVNYTAAPLQTGEYSQNFTSLAAGVHTYKWYANDTSGNQNISGNFNFTVNKASTTTTLYITGLPDQDVTVNYSSPLNVTAVTTGGNVLLLRDFSSISNPDTSRLAVGSYSYFGTNGGNANFTGSVSPIQTLTVVQISPYIELLLNGNASNVTSDIEDFVNITVQLLAGEASFNVYQNGSLLNTSTNITLIREYNVPSVVNISANMSSTQNFTAFSAARNINVVNVRPPLAVSGLANQSSTPTNIYWNWTNPASKDFNHSIIYLNNSQVAITSNNFYNASNLSVLQPYIITINTVDAAGNVNTANVSSVAFTSDGFAPAYSNLAAPGAIVYSPGTLYVFSSAWTDNLGMSGVILTFDGVGNTASQNGTIYDVTLSDLAAGSYQYNWTGTDIAGNTNSTPTSTLTVLQQGTATDLIINGLTNQNVSINFSYQSNISFTTTNVSASLYRDGQLIAAGFENLTFGAGTYEYVAINNGNRNFTASNSSFNLTVLPIASQISLLLNGTQGNLTMEVNSPVNLTGILFTPEGGLLMDWDIGGGERLGVVPPNLSNVTELRIFDDLGTNAVILFYAQTQNFTESRVNYNASVVDTTSPAAGNIVEPTDATLYSGTNIYQFTADWTDNFQLDHVDFEFDGVNYTTTNASNITFSAVRPALPAGTYGYRWYATDTSDNEANTAVNTFTVSKQSTSANLIINGLANQNVSINYLDPLNVTVTTSNLTVSLLRDGQLIQGNSDNELLGAGSYVYLANNSGNQNYTASNSTFNLTVLPIAPQITLTLNGSSANITAEAGSAVLINGTLFAGETNITLYENSTILSAGSNISTSRAYVVPRLVVFTLNYIATQNYTASSATFNASIVDSTAPLASSITEPADPTVYLPSESYDFGAIWTDFVGVDNVSFEFGGTNFTPVQTGNTHNVTLPALPAGTYGYRWYANDTSGNNAQTNLLSFTVIQANSTANISINGFVNQNVVINYTSSGNATFNSTTSNISFLRNGTVIAGQSDNQTLAAGYYNYTIIDLGNTNYTGSRETAFLNVLKLPSSVSLSLDGTQGNITASAEQSVNITGTLNAGEAQLQIFVNGILRNTSLSPVLFNFTSSIDGLFAIVLSHPESQNFTAINVSYNISVPDTVAPVITVNSPQNNSLLVNSNVALNVSALETSPDTLSYSLDGAASIILARPYVSTLNYLDSNALADGSHNITVFANDTSGLSSMTIVFFRVDSIAPVNLSFTPNATTIDSTPGVFMLFDESIYSGNISIDGANQSAAILGANNLSLAVSAPLTHGIHTITAYATDAAGNLVVISWSFDVDREGFLQGYVNDSSGGPLFNAQVIAKRGNTVNYSVLTDPNGFYRINPFDEGVYNITISKAGYSADRSLTNFVMNGSAELERNITLIRIPDSSSTGVSVSPNRVEGQILQVQSIITYTGNGLTLNVNSTLYVDDVAVNSQNHTLNGTPLTVQFNWSATEGSHTIKIGTLPVVDETNLINNNATTMISVTPAEAALTRSSIELYNGDWTSRITNASQNRTFNIFMSITNNQSFTLFDIGSLFNSNSAFPIISGSNPQVNNITAGGTAFVTWLANATETGYRSINITTEDDLFDSAMLNVTA